MKKLRYIIIAFLSLGLFSCSDYLEHNFNDQMTIEEVFSSDIKYQKPDILPFNF